MGEGGGGGRQQRDPSGQSMVAASLAGVIEGHGVSGQR